MIENKIETLDDRVPTDLRFKIIACLRGALEEDLPLFQESSHLVTHNGDRHLKGDYINTRMQNEIACDDIEVVAFSRYGSETRIIIDRSNRIAYNVISKSRMTQLMREAITKNVPHYTLLFAYALNSDLKASQKQLSMFNEYPFNPDVMEHGYNKLLGGQLQPNSGYRYCVITYEVKSGFLLDCEILMLDRDLDIITKVDLADYITPEYALLTQRDSEDLEQHDSQHRVKLKKKFTQEDSSLVALKEAEKENRA